MLSNAPILVKLSPLIFLEKHGSINMCFGATFHIKSHWVMKLKHPTPSHCGVFLGDRSLWLNHILWPRSLTYQQHKNFVDFKTTFSHASPHREIHVHRGSSSHVGLTIHSVQCLTSFHKLKNSISPCNFTMRNLFWPLDVTDFDMSHWSMFNFAAKVAGWCASPIWLYAKRQSDIIISWALGLVALDIEIRLFWSIC